jgi:Zn-finger nucleic acid-binding protein
MTRCPSCGAGVADENVFPGGSVQCTCGAAVVVAATAAVSHAAAAESTGSAARVTRASICPRCPAELVVRDEEGMIVAACPAHHGIFVTHRALAQVERLSADGPRAVDVPAISCPRCSEPMTARTFARGATIVVDVCDEHGTWFDAGELRAAAAAVALAARNDQRVVATDGEGEVAEAARADVNRRAVATLDVALAFEEVREEQKARDVVALADDVVDTFNLFVLGRSRSGLGSRYR